MKDWAADHPKAKLMARKRAAILEAAREMFLRLGYEGTSMEAIAASAGVSIMTLYRHAERKDDLFAAVISSACDPSDEVEQAEMAAVMKKPLGEVLAISGVMFQARLGSAETAALLRVVMAESRHFPELAEKAYRGLVGHMESFVEDLLAQKTEARGLAKAVRRTLSVTFVDRLLGTDLLRTLLGVGAPSKAEYRWRAERAADETMAAIASALSRSAAG
jgi:TetR/AcrR family transcriptional regulator, mexJK operon transcriptional repressor